MALPLDLLEAQRRLLGGGGQRHRRGEDRQNQVR
jgi:hypothetical protein